MKLNLAVYTAVEGYSWQTGTKISNNDLIEYKRIIGCFPDPTVDIIPFGGAFLCRNKAVFYRGCQNILPHGIVTVLFPSARLPEERLLR